MITIRHKIGFRRSATCIALVTLPLLALAVGVSTAWCDDKIAIQTVNAVGIGSGFKTPATTSCPAGDICYALSGKISGLPVGSASFAANVNTVSGSYVDDGSGGTCTPATASTAVAGPRRALNWIACARPSRQSLPP